MYIINDIQIPIDSNKKLRSETQEHPQSPSVISTYTEKEGPVYPKSKLSAREAITKELKMLNLLQEERTQ